MQVLDKSGENKAAAVAAAIARRNWREAQDRVCTTHAPGYPWVRFAVDRPKSGDRVVVMRFVEYAEGVVNSHAWVGWYVERGGVSWNVTIGRKEENASQEQKSSQSALCHVFGAERVYDTDSFWPHYWMRVPEVPWEDIWRRDAGN